MKMNQNDTSKTQIQNTLLMAILYRKFETGTGGWSVSFMGKQFGEVFQIYINGTTNNKTHG